MRLVCELVLRRAGELEEADAASETTTATARVRRWEQAGETRALIMQVAGQVEVKEIKKQVVYTDVQTVQYVAGYSMLNSFVLELK